MRTSSAELQFGSHGEGLYLAIDGQATRDACAAADRLVCDYLAAHQSSARIVLDLASALWVDSTFAGWMLQARGQVGKLPGGSLVLCGCSESCRRSLDTMGITTLIPQRDVRRPETMTKIDCRGADVPQRAMLELMARAHEELASLDDENQRVFGPIAATLRRELDQDRRPPD